MKTIIIYGLVDPFTHIVKYVGATSRPKNRLSEHFSKAGKYHANVSQWLGELKSKGVRPEFRSLEEVTLEVWEAKEREWISVHRQNGELLNQTEGGLGTPGLNFTEEHRRAIGEHTRKNNLGRIFTPEQRARMSHAQKAIVAKLAAQGLKKTHAPPTEETKARISRALTGRKLTPEQCEHLSKIRANPPQELRDKWAEAARKRDPEWKAWFAKQQAGVAKSEETKKKMSEAAKRRWAKHKAERDSDVR